MVSLATMILVKILKEKFIRLIGLKSLKDSGLGILEIKAFKMVVEDLRSLLN